MAVIISLWGGTGNSDHHNKEGVTGPTVQGNQWSNRTRAPLNIYILLLLLSSSFKIFNTFHLLFQINIFRENVYVHWLHFGQWLFTIEYKIQQILKAVVVASGIPSETNKTSHWIILLFVEQWIKQNTKSFEIFIKIRTVFGKCNWNRDVIHKTYSWLYAP